MTIGAVISPESQTLTFGKFKILGRAPGTYVTVTPDVPNKITMVGGVDGDSYMVVSGVKSVTITVTLLPTSVENAIFTNFFKAFMASPNGLITPILVKQGPSVNAGLGVVAGIPPMEFSDAATPVPWTLLCGTMEMSRNGVAVAPTFMG